MTVPTLPLPFYARPLAGGWLMALLTVWLGIDQLLFWRFLNIMPIWVYPVALFIIGLLAIGVARAMPGRNGPTPATLACCFGIALLLLILGGEGRFFYANIDWQVRFAVLRDLHINPWPFTYQVDGAPQLLRAPIGMFLLPALVGKIAGAGAADMALLIQNSLMLGIVLALGATLFPRRYDRLMALIIFIGFSGLDALGRMLFRGGLSDHIENWAYLQFSSTITLAFWVPQHAMAGWIGALGYLLGRDGRARPAAWLTPLPLTALWSPLGLAGALPFVALTGARSLFARNLRPADILLPGIASLIAIPSLLYLAAGLGDMGGAAGEPGAGIAPSQWLAFELLEMLVYAVPLAFVARRSRFGIDSLILVTIWLLLIPFLHIGWSTDFMMRGSITALAILAVLVADAMRTEPRLRLWLGTILLIGSITGLHEVMRALSHPPAPQVRCDLVQGWDFEAIDLGLRKTDDPPSPKGTYLAPIDAIPRIIRPYAPYPADMTRRTRCWDGHWYYPNERPE